MDVQSQTRGCALTGSGSSRAIASTGGPRAGPNPVTAVLVRTGDLGQTRREEDTGQERRRPGDLAASQGRPRVPGHQELEAGRGGGPAGVWPRPPASRTGQGALAPPRPPRKPTRTTRRACSCHVSPSLGIGWLPAAGLSDWMPSPCPLSVRGALPGLCPQRPLSPLQGGVLCARHPSAWAPRPVAPRAGSSRTLPRARAEAAALTGPGWLRAHTRARRVLEALGAHAHVAPRGVVAVLVGPGAHFLCQGALVDI